MLIGACGGVVLFFVLRSHLRGYIGDIEYKIARLEDEINRIMDEITWHPRDPFDETATLPAQGDRGDEA
jgi:hypothetical protein